ncbi:hypothetical protein BOX15_Mlig025362g2 [Macrostomum lignano]|uniref:Sorting nexin/Vps5-like C-terminal domain-containing protein n=1 Tax=Macrostomum lignano TaxID=282301 RepID=A0A267G456_9PLAT|nr:hypothetical protein BOX15_Mlig025362g2 [Macrostomum lignano]
MAQSIISLCQLQASQAEVEELELCDLLADHNDGLASQRDCLTERARARRALSDAETALNKRREARIRAELAGRAAASGPSPADIEALEDEVERRQLDFEAVSQAARRELARADRRRDVELRAAVAACLRSQAEAARRALIGLEAAASETAELLAPADRAVSQSVTGSSADC